MDDSEIKFGSLHKVIISLTAPLLVQNVVRVGQSLIDLMWLGQYSSEAVAAVGVAIPILGLLLSLVVTGPFVGTQVTVSQRIGKDDKSGAQRVTFVGIVIGFVIASVCGLLLFVVVDDLISLLLTLRPQDEATPVVNLASVYLKVLGAGVFIATVGNVIEASFLGHGDSRAALYMNVVTVVTNLSLDPIFIFGIGPVPELGIVGAAIALLFGYLAGLLLGLIFVCRGRCEGVLSMDELQFESNGLYEIVDVGLPIAAQNVSRKISRLFFIVIVFALAGSTGLVAYIVASRVALVAAVPANGLKTATQSIVGQNVGADQRERAVRSVRLTIGYCLGILTLIAVLQILFLEQVANTVATELSGDEFRLTVEGLRIWAYGYPALGVLSILQGGFNGISRTRVSFVSSLVQHWALRLPIAFVGGFLLDFSVLIAFWAIVISNYVLAFGLSLYYRLQSSDWTIHQNIEEDPSDLG